MTIRKTQIVNLKPWNKEKSFIYSAVMGVNKYKGNHYTPLYFHITRQVIPWKALDQTLAGKVLAPTEVENLKYYQWTFSEGFNSIVSSNQSWASIYIGSITVDQRSDHAPVMKWSGAPYVEAVLKTYKLLIKPHIQ